MWRMRRARESMKTSCQSESPLITFAREGRQVITHQEPRAEETFENCKGDDRSERPAQGPHDELQQALCVVKYLVSR